ncbi:GbsR/MarR family transcriptional regulator [Paenibacillus alkalitolerans]|uniref:GbsR/MarR family transcriptional regulator n=1 Tax=Paenibacillus alkalitolerans TaxID=2799335 RepID=UPI0018F642AF|nr:GbsR/MarR family transcriptional regulator [Paenibacillus alkalitolerans]
MNPWEGITEQQASTIHKARKRVIESIGANMDLYGVTHSTGHLYGLMFFQDRPMTLDEMGGAMEMSKTSMSTGVRTLLDLKMVHKVWEKGSRKDYYEVETDWYQTFADFFVVKWKKSVEMNLQAIRKSKQELEGLAASHPEDAALADIVDRDIQKLEETIRYYLWLLRLIDTFESGEIFKLVPKD